MNKSNAGYLALWRVRKKAVYVLESWGMTVFSVSPTGDPFDLIALDERKVLLIRIVIGSSGKGEGFGDYRKALEKIPAPASAKKQLWVFDRKCGFTFYNIKED